MLSTYSARNAAVRFGAITVTAKRWQVTSRAEKLDTSNFEGGGYTENIAGLRSIDVTIEFNDSAIYAYFATGLITAGALFANVKLYLNSTSGPFWDLPYLFIESVQQSADVHQAMELTLTGSNHGPFAYPLTFAGATT